ncbi:MAG: ABC transporter ATP-binding protein [Chloroflexia bacterium]|nr:ABC transporter ATP-binding protein [Chloroflexia bacterium]
MTMTEPRTESGPPQGMPPDRLAVRGAGLVKVYGTGETAVRALRNVTVEIAAGRFTAIMGPSGSGKSTLMHCLAGLDSVTQGEVCIGDTLISALDDDGRTRLRRDRVGFVFQSLNLLPAFTARQNILLPMDLSGRKPDRQWFDLLADTLGLADRLDHRPSELSGGQQQRVAIARALMPRPDVVFADEPTGNLDSRSSRQVLVFLQRSVREYGQTVVMVTHDPIAAAWADRAIILADGEIVHSIDDPTTERVISVLSETGGESK